MPMGDIAPVPGQTEFARASRNDKAARRLPPVGSFLEIVKVSGGVPCYGGGPTQQVIHWRLVGSANSRPLKENFS